MKLFKGRRVVLENLQIVPACIVVEKGKILRISPGYDSESDNSYDEVVDAGDLILMPGVVDTHVHISEPGRTHWEGFITGTKAAAAGGITAFAEMPLNANPPTITLENFELKIEHAKDKCYVDVCFWGGSVPGNQKELRPMIERGVSGFKCFMITCGTDEFRWSPEKDFRSALEELKGTGSVLQFHAELTLPEVSTEVQDRRKFKAFLKTKPVKMELEAVRLVCKACSDYRVRCHIVHLSAANAIPLIQAAKDDGAPLTVETTHHYLALCDDDIPDGATEMKCCPPIREKENQDRLWDAVKSGAIDMVVSDHSPCPEELKAGGDFVEAFGGISGVQFGLSVMWTNAIKHGMSITDMVPLLCQNTAKLCGLGNRKGTIKEGYDADFVIWDPDRSFKVTRDIIEHKHKITAYMNMELKGVIHRTVVRGTTVYNQGKFSAQPMGKLIFPNQN